MSDAGTKCSATATHELPGLALVGNLNDRLVALGLDLERPVLHVALNLGIVDLPSNKTLRVEDGVFRVGVVGVFRGVTDTVSRDVRMWDFTIGGDNSQSFIIREADP